MVVAQVVARRRSPLLFMTCSECISEASLCWEINGRTIAYPFLFSLSLFRSTCCILSVVFILSQWCLWLLMIILIYLYIFGRMDRRLEVIVDSYVPNVYCFLLLCLC